jgi:hypothetical protein
MCLNFLGFLNDSVQLFGCTFKQSNLIETDTIVQALFVRDSENAELGDLVFIFDQLK